MVVLTLKAKHDHLEKVSATRDYVKALAEFVWNALDADAKKVSVDLVRNALGGIETILICDDGTGITKARAAHDFESLGESWKLKRRRTPVLSRAVHGKEGKGRLKFFSLAQKATWSTIYREGGGIFRLTIEIEAATLQRSQVSEPEPAPANTPTGTVVELAPLKDTFDWLAGEEAYGEFAAIFAPYILQYPKTEITYDSKGVDPTLTIDRTREFGTCRIVCPSGRIRNITLRVIEWKARAGSRKVYFGGESGVVLGSLPANITAPGFDFSAYAYSPFLQEIGDANLLEFDGLTDPDFAAVVEYIRDRVGDYFRERQAEKSSELIQELKNAGVYPYEGEPQNEVERKERQVFDIATQAASYSSVFKRADNSQKRVTLELLRIALRNNPEAILRILRAVFHLPKVRQDEFSGLLEKTELGHIISASSLIADRVVALKVLRDMVFEPMHRQTIKERGELDALVRDNTWIFGESFHFTMAEVGLTKIMDRVSEQLALQRAKGRKGRKPDGKIGRIDSFMGRIVPYADRQHHEFLLIELKRPSLVLGRKELDQLEDYVNALLAQPDFLNTSTFWNFYLVGTEYDDVVKERITQKERPVGLMIDKPNHKVWVKSWAELIRDAEGRLSFVQEKLQVQVSSNEIEERISQLKSSISKGSSSSLSSSADSGMAAEVPLAAAPT